MGKFIVFGEEFLSRLREEVNLPELVGRQIKLKRSGRSFVSLCPFHEDKTPSFHVNPEKNTFRCYGCPAAGDAIEWMKRAHHLSFYDAVVALAQECGIPLPAGELEESEDKDLRKRLAKYYQVLKDAARLYEEGLEKNPSGRSYLETTRGLSKVTIKKFGLGVVSTGVVRLLSSAGNETLLGSGLAAKNDAGIYDRFRQRVMLPIVNEGGNLVGFAGRSLIAKPEKAPKYLNCPETEIFHKGKELYGLHFAKPAIRKAKLAVMVEGYFDVICAHQAGDERVVAPMGTAVTNQQMRRLLVHTDNITFAFDGDRAGRRAALSAAAVVLDEIKDGQTARFLFLPEGEDPDSFIRKFGIEAWFSAVDGADQLSTFLGNYIAHKLDRSVPEQQVLAANKAKAILARIKKALLFRHALRLKFEELVSVPLS
ncbi:DNA primase [Pseudomonas sp. AB12(2023)]|uniref:DNA primase n=1 Tax=Pseudomonas sp. AB12(2023) TaxID=3048597 RepID=UPI002B2261BE|nr:DNA primase [Pseudomonas sp. AB12(2023)]MEB0221368.1 DNA primase [Pseudomonas sp. AB12(2023)]